MAPAMLPAMLIEEYLKYLQGVRKFSPLTLKSYREDLSDFADYCANYGIAPEAASKEDIQAYIMDMSLESKAVVSVNRAFSSLRGFYKYLIRFERRKDNPLETLKNLKAPRKLPVFLWEDEMRDFALLSENSTLLWAERDKALIMVIYSAGLRISEALALELTSFDTALSCARVTGKGGVERAVFFTDEAKQALREYLPLRAEKLKDSTNSALFLNKKGGALSIPGARWIICEYAKISKSAKNVHPHSLRHSFATHLMNAGCDIRVVQELLGHKNLSTTQIYTHTNIEKLKDVYKKSHPHA